MNPSARRRAALIAMMTAWLVVACSPPPTAIVPLEHNDFGDFSLLVYDRSGLVIAGRSGGGHREGTIQTKAIVQPESSEIVVTWTGGACSHAPTLAISGDASDLRLVLSSPSDAQIPFLPIACPAVGILFSVTLGLTHPVEQAALSIEDTGD